MWEIDLSKYCGPATLNDGKSFYENYGISHKKQSQMFDGSWQLQGKAVDSFCFVNHPRLRVDASCRRIVDYGCDCTVGRSGKGFCEHCVALALAMQEEPAPVVPQKRDYHPDPKPLPQIEEKLMGWRPHLLDPEPMPQFDPAPAPQPESKPEPKPIPQPKPEPVPQPAPEPIPEPEPEPVPQPEPIPEPEPEPESWEQPEEEPEQPAPEEPANETIGTMEILFGHNMTDEEPVMWFPNDTERVFHTNVGIIGTMGTGKTQFTKSMVTQLYRSQQSNFNSHPLGILIFDYKGDYNETKTDFVKATNARVLKPYRLPFNPLALNRTQAFRPLLPMRTANEFKDTISKIFNLGVKQQQTLLDCIVKAYARQGIDPVNPNTWGRKAPTFDQVYQVFEEEAIGRPVDSLTAAMRKIYQFCLFEADPRQAISLEQLLKGVVVIDLSGYDSDIQSLIVAITLDQFYSHMQKSGSSRTDGRYRQLRCFILVDEADSFMSQDFPSLRKIMKEGREFGVGMILSTQSLAHFVSGEDDYSRYVLTWIVHNVNDLKQKDVEYVFKLQPKSPEIVKYYSTIKALRKHESVIKLANDLPISIRDKAFWQLYQEI